MVRRFEGDQNYFADNSTLADTASEDSPSAAKTNCKYSYFCWSVNDFVILYFSRCPVYSKLWQISENFSQRLR